MPYFIGARPNPDPEIDRAVELFRGRSTGTVGHWRSLGHAPGLFPLMRPAQAVGRVVTARISAFDASSVHYAVSILEPGEILVIDTGGECVRAPWGGGTSYAALQAGAAGVVVDGPITDWDEITTMGVQTWSRGTTSVTYRPPPPGIPAEGGVNIPVNIAGAVVRPGDIAFADSDGVMFIRREDAVADGTRLQEVATKEREETWRAMAGGTLLFDTRGQRERYESEALSMEQLEGTGE